MGLPLQRFAHYTFNAGENKGEPVTFLSKSELSRSLNVEQRGRGLATRFGSQVLNVDINGFPAPIDPAAGNKFDIRSGFGFTYGANQNLAIYTADQFIYKDELTPTILTAGLTPNLPFQFQQAADILYLTNGTDAVRFFQPNRDLTITYTAGYDTPAAFNAADGVAPGVIGAGTYEYFVTLYDATTRTESNRQAAAVSVTLVGAGHTVDLTNLPIDPEARTTHWRIYRKDPTGYYHYDLDEVVYNAGAPNYTDNTLATGRTRIAPNDNDKPDVSKAVCLGPKIMFYGLGSVLSWSKPYRYQNVPTYNRETLEDDSSAIQKIIYFKGAVVVWKSRSIYVLRGNFSEGDYTVKRISGTIGTVSPDSVQEASDGIFFFGSDGKPRFINPTDFDAEDLRDQTDISYKYSEKFEQLNPLQYPNVFAVLVNYRRWDQYRIFVPVDINTDSTNEVFVFDYGLAQRNNGDSAWFTFRYNLNMRCAWLQHVDGERQKVYVGDDYSLLWELDTTDEHFDGAEFVREEDDGVVTYGVNTITVSTATMDVNAYVGMQVILYDAFTFFEIFRSRVVSNTATTFTVEDAVPVLPTNNPYITVGGYQTYFGTANYTHDRAGRCRPFKASVLLGQDVGEHDVYFFINYDFNTTFNFRYDYINNPLNASLTPRADIYLLAVGTAFSTYNFSVYNTARYGEYLYDTSEFLLFNKYLFNHASWGIITIAPSKPFIYLGSSIFYQYKSLTNSGLPQ